MFIGFDLLDRQILDRDGQPVGKVDDVELTVDADGVPHVSALLVGQQALGERIGGRLGRTMAGMARRLRDDPGPTRIDYSFVAKVGSAVNLRVRKELLTEPPLEAWLGEHVIGRIPGASDAG